VIAMTVQRKRGRPSDYCAEIAMTICDRLADGESLRAICADDGMPNKATVFRWIGRHKDFRDQYAVAREVQADDILDEILEIAHDDSRDHVKKVGADGKVTWVVDHVSTSPVVNWFPPSPPTNVFSLNFGGTISADATGGSQSRRGLP
jgi:Bacteriophage Sf6, terminase small subunit-like